MADFATINLRVVLPVSKLQGLPAWLTATTENERKPSAGCAVASERQADDEKTDHLLFVALRCRSSIFEAMRTRQRHTLALYQSVHVCQP